MTAIDAIAQRYIDTAYARDTAALLALHDERVVVYDMWDRWCYHGRDAWAAAVHAWLGGLGDERVRVAFTPQLERVTGDSAVWAAIVRYAAEDAAGIELRAMQNRMSWMLRRGPAGWLIVHEHSSAPAAVGSLAVSLSYPGEEG